MKVNVLFLYVIHLVIYTLLLFLFRELIINKDVFQMSFGEQMDDSMIARMYKMHEEYAYLQYMFIPISLLFKVSATAACIYLRCFFSTIKVQFLSLLRMALWAEFVFVVMEFYRYWHLSAQGILSLEYAQWYSPFSLLELFEVGELALWYVYPLKTCNIFELLYLFCLAFLACKFFKWTKGKAIEILVLSYGIGLVFWQVLVSFLTLNLV